MAIWNLAGGGKWNLAGNWSSGVIPNAIDAVANFPDYLAGFGETIINLGGLTDQVGTLSFEASSVDARTVITGTINMNSSFIASIKTTKIGNGTALPTIFGSDVQVLLSSPTFFSINAATELDIQGSMSGTGNLYYLLGGLLSLSGNNSARSGLTVLEAGTINITNGNALGSGDVVFSNGTLRASATMSVANHFSFNLPSASGTLTAATGKVLTLTGAFDIGGTALHLGSATDTGTILFADNFGTTADFTSLNIDGGIVKADISGNFNALFGLLYHAANTSVAAGAEVQFDQWGGTKTIQNLSGAGNVTYIGGVKETLFLDEAADETFSGVLGQAGNNALTVYKDGAGTLKLSNIETYTGATNVAGGKLELATGGALDNSSSVNVYQGATLMLDAGAGQILQNLTNHGTVYTGSNPILAFVSADLTGTFDGGNNTGPGGLELAVAANLKSFSEAGAAFVNWGKSGNYIIGNNLGDSLTGSSQDDFIFGGSGNDSLDGGAGVNTGVFKSSRAGATITYHSDHTVTIQSALDGTDTLTHIQFAKFSDQTISLVPVPVAKADSYSTAYNTALTVTGAGVLANDTDPASLPLSASVAAGPAHGALALNSTGAFVYTPTAGYFGADSFTYAATNTAGNSANATVAINVGTPPPVANPDSYSTAFNTALTVAGAGVLANDTDAAGLALSAALAAGPAHGTLALSNTGAFVYTPTTGFSGADGFTYTATDTAGNSAAGTVSINVGAPPPPPPPANFTITDTSTGVTTSVPGDVYSGPVAGLAFQYIYTGTDNTNVTGNVANAFIHTGSGFDAIDVSAVGGTNVLDGGTNSNFLVGGTAGAGSDTFFVDDRSPPGDIWSTVGNFHVGDAATIFGITQNGFSTNWVDGEGATGFTGVTLHVTAPGVPTASITLAGYSVADLSNGRLSQVFGTEPDGTPYLYIHGDS